MRRMRPPVKTKPVIPDALTKHRRWILWDERHVQGKSRKVPLDLDGNPISATDAAHWTHYPTARRTANQLAVSGIGFVLTNSDDFVVFDLDGCRDPKTGVITREASKVIRRLNSYTEVSPSRTGVKIFLRATLTLPGNRGAGRGECPWPRVTDKKAPGFELFTANRYMAVTGKHLASTPKKIHRRQAEATSIFNEFFRRPEPTPSKKTHDRLPTASEFGKAISAGVKRGDILTYTFDNREWGRVSSAFPCPNCGKPDNCNFELNGRYLFCGRPTNDHETNDGGQVLIRLDREGDDDTDETVSPKHLNAIVDAPHGGLSAQPKTKPTRWDRIARRHQNVRAQWLIIRDLPKRVLGVSSRSVELLGTGYDEEGGAWTLPERNEHGRVTGIALRYVFPIRDDTTGKERNKGFMRGGKRGLYFESRWHEHSGSVLIVEGFSCTAAQISMGHAVIGRPSAYGGAELISRLAAVRPNREYAIIAENDYDPETKRFPGRDGAMAIARELAGRLGKPIDVAFVGEHKDSRSFLNDQVGDDLSRQSLQEASELFWQLIKANTTTVQPPRTYPLPATSEQSVVTMADYRDQMRERRLETINKPGNYVDASGTGFGKSTADGALIEHFVASGKRTITFVPVHDNCREEVDRISDCGLTAVAFPRLDESTCQNFARANHCLQLGLGIGAAVCGNCSFKGDCTYRQQVAEALRADIAVACISRLRCDGRVLQRRDLVLIHEDCEAALRPQHAFEISALEQVRQTIQKVIDAEWRKGLPGYREDFATIRYLDHLVRVGDHMLHAAEATKSGQACRDDLDGSALKSGYFQKLLQQRLFDREETFDRLAMRGLLAVARGADWDILKWPSSSAKSGKADFVARIVVTEPVKLPDNQVRWFENATGSAKRISQLIGQEVIDQTPKCRVERKHDVTILPRDITKNTSTATVQELIRATLLSTGCQRLGVIGHRRHICELFRSDETSFAGQLRNRVLLNAYFGEGPDRASNEWLRCDHLLVLGTHRIPDVAIRMNLYRRGLVSDALIDPTWGTYFWDSKTPSGKRIRIRGKSYEQDAWHEELLFATRASLLQCLGRARAVLDEGIPVFVCTDEIIQEYPVDPNHVVATVPTRVLDAVEAVWRLTVGGSGARVLEGSDGVRWASTTSVAKLLGKKRNQHGRISEALAAGQELGLVMRSKKRKGGWSMACV